METLWQYFGGQWTSEYLNSEENTVDQFVFANTKNKKISKSKSKSKESLIE